MSNDVGVSDGDVGDRTASDAGDRDASDAGDRDVSEERVDASKYTRWLGDRALRNPQSHPQSHPQSQSFSHRCSSSTYELLGGRRGAA
jgi:hypothetical protein